jgi:hypothetical protein
VSTIFTYLDTQLPLSYVHIIVWLTKLVMYVQALQCALLLVFAIRRTEKTHFQEETGRTQNTGGIYLTVKCVQLTLSVVIYPLMYQAMLDRTFNMPTFLQREQKGGSHSTDSRHAPIHLDPSFITPSHSFPPFSLLPFFSAQTAEEPLREPQLWLP